MFFSSYTTATSKPTSHKRRTYARTVCVSECISQHHLLLCRRWAKMENWIGKRAAMVKNRLRFSSAWRVSERAKGHRHLFCGAAFISTWNFFPWPRFSSKYLSSVVICRWWSQVIFRFFCQKQKPKRRKKVSSHLHAQPNKVKIHFLRWFIFFVSFVSWYIPSENAQMLTFHQQQNTPVNIRLSVNVWIEHIRLVLLVN